MEWQELTLNCTMPEVRRYYAYFTDKMGLKDKTYPRSLESLNDETQLRLKSEASGLTGGWLLCMKSA